MGGTVLDTGGPCVDSGLCTTPSSLLSPFFFMKSEEEDDGKLEIGHGGKQTWVSLGLPFFRHHYEVSPVRGSRVSSRFLPSLTCTHPHPWWDAFLISPFTLDPPERPLKLQDSSFDFPNPKVNYTSKEETTFHLTSALTYRPTYQ